MDSGRLFFDPLSCGNTLFFGNGDSVFRGTRSVMSMGGTLKSRPFFSPPEELFDEENYDEQSLEKKRRLTPEQVHLLEKSFELENKLEPEHKTELAKKLGMQPRQVAVWFQNRRARWKTKQLEREFDRLKLSYESLLSDCKSVSKENEKLKAEVVSLTEMLAGASCPKQNPHPTEVPIFPPLQIDLKAEDRLSTGTGGSAVVDEDGRQLMDSGNSYFLNCDYPAFVAPADGFQSEEEEGYFSDAFPAVKQFPEEGEPLGSRVWS